MHLQLVCLCLLRFHLSSIDSYEYFPRYLYFSTMLHEDGERCFACLLFIISSVHDCQAKIADGFRTQNVSKNFIIVNECIVIIHYFSVGCQVCMFILIKSFRHCKDKSIENTCKCLLK